MSHIYIIKNFNKAFVLLVTIISFALPVFSATICADATNTTISEVLEKTERPDILDLVSLSKSTDANNLKDKTNIDKEDNSFKIIFEVANEIIEMANDRPVYIFARDGELFYDAVQLILSHQPELANKEQFKLINVSRPLAKNTDSKQLLKLFSSFGLDVSSILNGKQKVLFLDTGYRGSIFLRLFSVFSEKIDFDLPADKVQKQIINLLKGIDAKLFVSQAQNTMPKVLNEIKERSWSDKNELQLFLNSNLYFPEYFESRRAELNIPENRQERHRWLVDNIEHLPHFTGRALQLNQDGNKVQKYENVPQTEKDSSVGIQLKMISFYNNNLKPKKQNEITNNNIKLKVTPLPEAFKKFLNGTLNKGDSIELPSGKIVTYIEKGGKGRRGIVLKVKDESGRLFALKIAKDEKEKTLESFAKEIEKSQGAQNAGFKISKILESGLNFHLKEWAEGLLAETWVKQWQEQNYPSNDPALLAIKKNIALSAKKGLYTGDLNRKNLIWDGKDWLVIDSGSTKTYESQAAKQRYIDNISKRWAKKLDSAVADRLREELSQ